MPIISGGGGGSGSGVISKIYFNKPAANITRAAASIGAFSTAWQLTGVVVAAGQNVKLHMSAMISAPSGNDTTVCILRGATQIATVMKVVGVGDNSNHMLSIDWVDANPGAGTYTYEVQAAQWTSGTLTVFQTNPTTDTFGGTSILIAEVYTP